MPPNLPDMSDASESKLPLQRGHALSPHMWKEREREKTPTANKIKTGRMKT